MGCNCRKKKTDRPTKRRSVRIRNGGPTPVPKKVPEKPKPAKTRKQ